jgi:hypothetical protein
MRNSPVVGILVGVIVVLLLIVYSMGMKIGHISGNRDDGVRAKIAAEETAFVCTQKLTDSEIALKKIVAQVKAQEASVAEAKVQIQTQAVRIVDLQKENERLKRSAASVTMPAAVSSGM